MVVRAKERQIVMTDEPTKDMMSRVLAIIKELRPQTIVEARDLLVKNMQLEARDALRLLDKLYHSGELKLREPRSHVHLVPSAFDEYLFQRSAYSAEFWFVVIGTLIFIFTIFTIPAGSIFIPIRAIAALIFALLIPGLSFVALLFPEYGANLNLFERLALSLGLSLGIHLGLGLMLDVLASLEPRIIAVVEAMTAIILQMLAVYLRLQRTSLS